MIKHISLGTSEVFYYNYFGELLPLRPINTYELDDCFYNSLATAQENIVELVVKFKLGVVKPKTNIKIDNKSYAELQKYFNNIDYWIIFYAMKDFQDEDFTKLIDGIPSGIHLVQKMRRVHLIAKAVLTASYQPKEIIQEIVRSDEGKTLATIVFTLNVPLTKISKMTRLQRDFLVYSKLQDSGTKHTISKTGDKVKIRKNMKEVV